MYKKLVPLFLSLAVSWSFFGCVTSSGNLKTYTPKSDTETQIMKSLLDYEKAFDARDLGQCLSHFHEDAQIEAFNYAGSGQNEIMDSRKEIATFCESRWSHDVRFTETSAPDITVSGDQALVKITRSFLASGGVRGSTNFVITMTPSDGGRWLIKHETLDIDFF